MRKVKHICVILFFSFLAKSQNPYFTWVKNFNGNSGSASYSYSKVDDLGNIYTCGTFSGTVDFDPNVAVYNVTSIGSKNVYILKLDIYGNFLWVKQFDGAINANSVVIDAVGDVYTAGTFTGTVDLDPNVGTYNLSVSTTSISTTNAFILKLSTNGNFVWAKQIIGDLVGLSPGQPITLDEFANVYVSGGFLTTASAGTNTLTSQGQNTYIAKYDLNGNFIWLKQSGCGLGSNLIWQSVALSMSSVVDKMGNVFSISSFKNIVDFDPGIGTYSLSTMGGFDIAITKLDAGGNFIWAKQIASSSPNSNVGLSGIYLDSIGNIYATGSFSLTMDFDLGAGVYNLSSNGLLDIYLLKLDANGNFVWAKQIGGTDYDVIANSVIDKAGNLYTAGNFYGTVDFDPNAGVNNLTSIGTYDGFVLKTDPNGNTMWAKQLDPSSGSSCGAYSIDLDPFSNIYVTGSFQGTVDFDPDVNVYNLSSVSNTDIFILKLSQSFVGIDEIDKMSAVVIYPNPNNGNFIIDNEREATISITNILGETVLTQQLQKGKNEVKLNDQIGGVYFINSKDLHFKLIKE